MCNREQAFEHCQTVLIKLCLEKEHKIEIRKNDDRYNNYIPFLSTPNKY